MKVYPNAGDVLSNDNGTRGRSPPVDKD